MADHNWWNKKMQKKWLTAQNMQHLITKGPLLHHSFSVNVAVNTTQHNY